MATRMQQRRGTASQWTIADPVLAAGEIGVESDTAKFKIGDGINTWSTLDYFSATPDLTGYATETYVDDAVAGVLDSAPAALDTLNELAAALNDDANFAATITTAIDAKQADVITTAGDLVVGDVNGDASRLAIGTDGQTLAVENGAITWKDSGSNNFVVEMSGSNNTVQLDSTKAAGTYNISLDSGDTTFDIYLVAPDGSEAGYSNSGSITATADFDTVVALGVASTEVIAFSFAGEVSTADGVGDEPGAAAYLTSITPSDLPGIDDTATVVGGNFGANTEITFESGATVLSAKNIVVTNSTELVVTRPDALIEDDAPYTVRAKTTGVLEPTGTNANILTDAVTAGSDPTWVTTSPLNNGVPGSAFSQTLEASDSDGTVVDYSVTAGTLTPGLSLNASTGVLSGTPTTGGNYTFTVTATDDGGNTTPKQFEQLVAVALGGTTAVEGGFTYHTFLASDDFEVLVSSLDVDYVVVAGGGGGGFATESGRAAGAGGAGGLLQGSSTLSAGTIAVSVGAGGSLSTNGSNSVLTGVATANGGGAGGDNQQGGNSGGSGGGGGQDVSSGASGIVGQGNDGGGGGDNTGGGGGGKTLAGSGRNGGDGILLTDYASASGINVDGGYFAGGGEGGDRSDSAGSGSPGLGGGGFGGDSDTTSTAGIANTGGGGGGGARGSGFSGFNQNGKAGGSGIVIVRYAN